MTKALYTGSFDPIHYGHIDAIERVARIFDHVVVGLGVNSDKKYTFSLEERLNMARHSLSEISNVRVEPFRGLTVDYAYEQGIPVTIKGVRNSEDFNYEQMLHQVGESQRLGIESFVIFSRPELAHISSGAVKALQKEQGFVHEYVPLYVKQKLEEKISGQFIVGLTGEIGAGKSYLAKKLVEIGGERGIVVHNIELDKIGHQILEKLTEPKYQELREAISREFGVNLRLSDGKIDRKALGEIVFSDVAKLNRLNELMHQSILVRLRREIYGRRGLVLLNAALITETNMTYLCNNNVLLVNSKRDIRNERLKERGLTQKQIVRRDSTQYNFELKQRKLQEVIERDRNGKLWVVDNSEDRTDLSYVFDNLVNHFQLSEETTK